MSGWRETAVADLGIATRGAPFAEWDGGRVGKSSAKGEGGSPTGAPRRRGRTLAGLVAGVESRGR